MKRLALLIAVFGWTSLVNGEPPVEAALTKATAYALTLNNKAALNPNKDDSTGNKGFSIATASDDDEVIYFGHNYDEPYGGSEWWNDPYGDWDDNLIPWDTFNFHVGDEAFGISFPSSPGIHVLQNEGFSLFLSPGWPVLSLVAAPREQYGQDLETFIESWSLLLWERYTESEVALISSAISQIDGFDTVEAIFFVEPDDDFIRLRLILTDVNSYVLSSTFASYESDDSNTFFNSFFISE
jgi:hypothetical protein